MFTGLKFHEPQFGLWYFTVFGFMLPALYRPAFGTLDPIRDYLFDRWLICPSFIDMDCGSLYWFSCQEGVMSGQTQNAELFFICL